MRPPARLRRGGLATVLAGGAVAAAVLVLGCGDSSPQVTRSPNCPPVSHPAPHVRPGLTIGLNSVWNNACNLDAIRSAGVTMERVDLDWAQVEPSRGRFDWRHYDHLVGIAAKHGITVMPLIMGVPGWAGPWDSVTADPPGFAAFVARAVSRYGPHGALWRAHPRLPYRPAVWFEIWNEPYLAQFSDGGPKPAAYAKLFKLSVMAGRKASPQARFLIAADTSGLTKNGDSIPWVDTMYRTVPDLGRYVDGVAVHPYSSRSPLVLTGGGPQRYEFRRIETLRGMFIAHGTDRPFWITEVGWATCPGNPSNCVTEEQQATYTGQVLDEVRRNYSAWVKAVFFYNFRDSPASTDPSDKEQWFGLIRRDGSAKPAWAVLQAQARLNRG
jgi:polysaccharide biosynthesis protein PslG